MIFLALVLALLAFVFGVVIGWVNRDRVDRWDRRWRDAEIRRLRALVDRLARPFEEPR